MPQTRATAVADELRAMIQSGELEPGARLRQSQVAERLGVSTTPVREAFTALAREGLVRQDAQRGAIVFVPSREELQENYEIRIALEPLATEFAAKQLNDEQLDEIELLVKQMRKETDARRYGELNGVFHATIYAASERPRLIELIGNLRDSALQYMRLVKVSGVDDKRYWTEAQHEHEEIAKALRSRAAKRAATLMAQHLKHSADHIAASVFDDS